MLIVNPFYCIDLPPFWQRLSPLSFHFRCDLRLGRARCYMAGKPIISNDLLNGLDKAKASVRMGHVVRLSLHNEAPSNGFYGFSQCAGAVPNPLGLLVT